MAITQAELDALNVAVFSGVSKVHYQDRTVEYDSMKDLLTARAIAYQSLNPSNSANGVVRQIRLRTSRGL